MAHDILILMGATGTGKSALALELAQQANAVIINADAMQLYADLAILTARPSEDELKRAPHALYGVLPATEPTSVARWLALVGPEIERAWKAGRLPLLVGGTGMYIKALQEGLAEVPPIPPSLRSELQQRYPDTAALYAALQEKDPVMTARLKPSDSQRILRALEVIEATGTSLSVWQGRGSQPIFKDAAYHAFYLDLPREKLYPRLDARFLQMMEQGALDEVRRLLALKLSAGLPITRATGVPELSAHLNQELSQADAIRQGQQSTRNYAKRQMTWLRNQMAEATGVPAENVGTGAAQAAEILRSLR